MSVMINVHDDLARRLQVEASNRGVTVEQLALAILEDAAPAAGTGVRIRRADGTTFLLRPEARQKSPLDVPGVNLDVSTEEIIACIREVRERT